MVNTLAAMHNLKGKQIDFTQAPLSRRIRTQKRKMGIKAQTQLVQPRTSISKLVPQTQRDIRTTWIQTIKIRSMPISPKIHDHRSIHR
jgi:hypothetical protein